MITSRSDNTAAANIRLFGNVRVMIISALFVAMSIVLGKYLAINVTPFIRISFENLSILMAGIFFGPFIGGAVGMIADIVGCMLVGYSINPVITVGGALIGILSGVISMYCFKKNMTVKLIFSVAVPHIICSMIIKSIGLHFFPPMFAWGILLYRIPVYIGIGTMEFLIIYFLLKNKAFSAQLDKVCTHGRR